jgi:putative Holliday junction resolvase
MSVMPEGTVLAFDFGERRIGVAMGETMLGIAHPLLTIDTEITDARFAAIGKLIDEWHPSQLVVGLPMHQDDTEHQMTSWHDVLPIASRAALACRYGWWTSG